MSFLWSNPLADMNGPSFLLLYFIVALITTSYCFVAMDRLDTTDSLPKPLVPQTPDHYEIAYLRGGRSELARVATYRLLRLGFIVPFSQQNSGRRGSNNLFVRPEDGIDTSQLAPIEAVLINMLAMPSRINSAIATIYSSTYNNLFTPYEEKLIADGMIYPPTYKAAANKIYAQATVVLLLLGVYKLSIALANGHYNVWYLILIAIFTCITNSIVTRTSRLTRRSKAYLKSFQNVFSAIRHPQSASAYPGGFDDNALLAFSIYGFDHSLAQADPNIGLLRRSTESYSSYSSCGTSGTGVGFGGSGGYSGGSSCGSASSSSSGSSCGSSSSSGGGGGSSCGGGGGGGGCGGCGGS